MVGLANGEGHTNAIRCLWRLRKTTIAEFSHGDAQSSGKDCEGDDVRAVRRQIMEHHADRRATR